MKATVTQETKPFRVVVGVDLSPVSAGVLRRALEIANLGQGAEVHVVAVADYDRVPLGMDGFSPEHTPPDAVVRLKDLATNVIAEAHLGTIRIQRVVTHLLTGSPAQEIVWLAAHIDADLIVVGTHGRRGVSRFFLGSVAERVVRMAGCPVYIARDKHHDSAWTVPEIEPPCPDCLAVRRESGDAKLWCDRHQGHIHTHVYSGGDAPVASLKAWGFTP